MKRYKVKLQSWNPSIIPVTTPLHSAAENPKWQPLWPNSEPSSGHLYRIIILLIVLQDRWWHWWCSRCLQGLYESSEDWASSSIRIVLSKRGTTAVVEFCNIGKWSSMVLLSFWCFFILKFRFLDCIVLYSTILYDSCFH